MPAQNASFSAITPFGQRGGDQSCGGIGNKLIDETMRFQVKELEVITETGVQVVNAIGRCQTERYWTRNLSSNRLIIFLRDRDGQRWPYWRFRYDGSRIGEAAWLLCSPPDSTNSVIVTPAVLAHPETASSKQSPGIIAKKNRSAGAGDRGPAKRRISLSRYARSWCGSAAGLRINEGRPAPAPRSTQTALVTGDVAHAPTRAGAPGMAQFCPLNTSRKYPLK